MLKCAACFAPSRHPFYIKCAAFRPERRKSVFLPRILVFCQRPVQFLRKGQMPGRYAETSRRRQHKNRPTHHAPVGIGPEFAPDSRRDLPMAATRSGPVLAASRAPGSQSPRPTDSRFANNPRHRRFRPRRPSLSAAANRMPHHASAKPQSPLDASAPPASSGTVASSSGPLSAPCDAHMPLASVFTTCRTPGSHPGVMASR